MELIKFSLCHFNDSIVKLMLKETGYVCLNEYELFSDNPKYEMLWNSNKGLFEITPNQNQDIGVYVRFVPMSSLCQDIKNYIYGYYLSNSQYSSFEDYYIANYRQLDDIRVWLPYKKSILNNHISCNEAFSSPLADINQPTSQNDGITLDEISTQNSPWQFKPLDGYRFKYLFKDIKGKSRRRIQLKPPFNDGRENIKSFNDRYTENIFNEEGISFEKSVNNFILSRKHADRLLELGAIKYSKE